MKFSWRSLDRADKRMYLFFGALTFWTPAGLALAAVSLMNGNHHEWPPDDIREAIGFWTAVGVFVFLMIGTFWSVYLQGGLSGKSSSTRSPGLGLPVDSRVE